SVFVEGKSSAVVVANAGTTFGSNPFSIAFVPDDSFYSILGLTWDRPLVYNIKYVNTPGDPIYKTLPTDLVEYRSLWTDYATNPGNEFNHPKYIDSYEIWNEPENEGAIPKPFGQNYAPFVHMMEATFLGLSGTGKKILLN